MSGIVAENSGRHTGLIKAASGGGGEWTLIQTLTSDGSDSDLSFTSGIDSTYDEYCFKFIGIHPETDAESFTFNGSSDGGSNYNVTKTTSFFRASHDEADSATALGYIAASDIAQGTGYQILMSGVGSDADQCGSGFLYLYNPSSTTFVKHFLARATHSESSDYVYDQGVAGYFNTTSAVDAIQFKFGSDEIQAGSISLYGIG